MTTGNGVPRMKPGMNWKERATELNRLGQGLYEQHQRTATELRRVTALLEHAAADEKWAAAHPWRALWRRLTGRPVGRAS